MLAADFTAPWAFLPARTKPLGATGLSGLLNAGAIKRPARVWLMEPYDPPKAVLLMVHGLLSTPLAWMDLNNDLMGDPDIRRHYQIWHFHYPTGLPFLYSAKVPREEYEKVRKLLDPRQLDPAMRQTLVIAHSMGGLISKTLTTDAGDEVWPAVLSRPPGMLKVTPEDRDELESIFPDRAVRRCGA